MNATPKPKAPKVKPAVPYWKNYWDKHLARYTGPSIGLSTLAYSTSSTKAFALPEERP